MAHSSRMLKTTDQIAADAAAATLRRTRHDAASDLPTSSPQPVLQHSSLPLEHEMVDLSNVTTRGHSQEPHSRGKELSGEVQSMLVLPGEAYVAPSIVMRSLSNKVRVQPDEASMDEGDSRRGSTNTNVSAFDDQVHPKDTIDVQDHRPTNKPRLSEQEWHTMANFAKAQGQDLMKQLEEQKKRRLADQEAGQPSSPDNIAKSEMDEMRRILNEKKPRDSEEYSKDIPSESERDSSPERVPRRRRHHHPHHHRHHQDSIEAAREYADHDTSSPLRDSATSEINEDLTSIAREDPSKVLDWLRGYGDAGTEKRIVLSEDRIMSLLQALRDGALGGSALSEGSFKYSLYPENWVPMERLREAERRSSVAEEQIRYFEQLFNMGEGSDSGGDQDEQLRSVLTKSKTMDRHFAHMKKFAEERHSDLRRTYSNISEKDVRTWRPNGASRGGMVSPEKAKKDLQEHESHKKRLVQVFSNYNELLRLVKVEHARRVEAENKSFQLTSQLKRQTATLKRAEKVIKHTALSPIMFNEPHSFSSRAPYERSSMQAPPSPYNNNYSGRQSPSLSSPSTPSASRQHVNLAVNDGNRIPGAAAVQLHSTSMNNIGKSSIRSPASSSPTPRHQTISKQLTYDLALDQPLSRDLSPVHSQLSASDLIGENHRREFQELEKALIEEGKSRGFADVDLYSEKKTVGREETSWEYRHVHVDFTKLPKQVCLHEDGAGPASPSSTAEPLDLTSFGNLPISRRTASPGRSEGSSFIDDIPRDLHDPAAALCTSLQHPAAADDDRHLLSSAKSIASYREELERLGQQEENKQIVGDPSPLQSCPSSPLKLHNTEVFSTPCMKITEESSRIEAEHDKNNAKKGTHKKTEMAQHSRADVATSDDLATGAGSVDAPIFYDRGDVADCDVARNTKASSKEKDDVDIHVAVQGSRSNEHVSLKHIRVKSTSDLRRRVAAIEAGHMARMLHSEVKRRRRVLVVQVVLFTAAFLWGVFPSYWHSIPPPT